MFTLQNIRPRFMPAVRVIRNFLDRSYTLYLLSVLTIALSGCGKGQDANTPPTHAIHPTSGQEAKITEQLSYNRDIRPILSDKCFSCHGPDGAAREAELRLDTPEDGEDYFGAMLAIVPGDPGASDLIARINSSKSRLLMPPPDSHLSLSDDEKALLAEWIRQGAEYEPHWSFVPLVGRIEPPSVKAEDWVRDSLDRFVLSRLEREGIAPNEEASRERWMRRVTFDLTGLPPTLEEITAFLDDKREDAYERVVDRLLASPHYGERMATQWIDLARYADSYGYQSDLLSPTWPWRDWAIRAFNNNLPYDQFIIDQLAGDLVDEPTREQRLATAFNRLHRMTNEGGSINEEWLNEYAADRLHTFGTAFMGLTFECARCHDHRYDPIAQSEYYELYAFFNSIDEWGTYHDSSRVPTPSLLLPNPQQHKQLEELKQAVAEAEEQLATKEQERLEDAYRAWLGQPDLQAHIPDLAGHYPLDGLEPNNKLANTANPGNPGSTDPANTLVEGYSGQALRMAGDADVSFGGVCGGLQPHDAFSVSFWLKLPKQGMTGVVFHRSNGSDVGYHGTDLVLEEGRLQFRMMRFWPGNAIAVQTPDTLPVDEWVQVTVCHRATFDASGMAIYLDGEPAYEVLRDNLTKYPGHSGHGLTFDHRFRGPTIPGALLDEVRAYNRALTPIEAKHLYDGRTLTEAIASRDADSLQAYFLSTQDAQVAAAREKLIATNRKLLELQTGLLEVPVMEDRAKPTPAYNLARGAYDAPQTEETRVYRDTPDALPPMPADAPRNRLGLAQWLTSDDHPLTARVAVNRLWQMCFGNGLVGTADDFGLQGALPTHPELLDYLARQYIDSGWDTKAMLKRIVLSATYRQDSASTRDRYEIDPGNELLARGPSRRLSAEMIRDTTLASSSLLNDTLGGPPVSPYQPPKLWRESNSMSPAYHQSVGKDLYRRSVYTVWKRTAPMPNMLAFDAPGREICAAERSETNTPMQALVLLNDVTFVEACRALAERVLREQRDRDDATQIEQMFMLLAGRKPDNKELELLLEMLDEQRAIFAQQPEGVETLRKIGESPIDPSLESAEVAVWTVLAQAILNYDATVWRR